MNVMLESLVRRLVRTGNLTLTTSDKTTRTFGDGNGQPVHVVIHTARAELAIALDPTLALPEAFMNGDLDVVAGDVYDLLGIAFRNMGDSGTPDSFWAKTIEAMRYAFRRVQQFNTGGRSRRNVQRHYDLSGELYRLFLDTDMQYSCAYFERPDMTLEEAQLAKKRHIAAKLKMKPGQTVLDIGSGWGGLGLYLAQCYEADVLGVTLSTEQHGVATERARVGGLDGHVHFDIRDYRDISERFDRIVSVGMFEHVGVNHFRTFFSKTATMLKPDGVMLLHTIGRSGPPSVTSAFIRKYIFPGGYIPALSEITPAIEKAGLVVTDIEVLRLHYAETLKNWRQRFMANRERAKAIYDEAFCRMWEFYLAASEASFRFQDMVVFQIQLARRNDTLPLTRDYIGKCEKALAMHEIAHGVPVAPAPEPTRNAPRSRRRRDAE